MNGTIIDRRPGNPGLGAHNALARQSNLPGREGKMPPKRAISRREVRAPIPLGPELVASGRPGLPTQDEAAG